jgi:hypothetical protein
MQISNLFKTKSKCFKLKKLYIKRLFDKIDADLFVEININKTSILEYTNKKKCVLHFKDKNNAELFRLIRDNDEKITSLIKKINSKNLKHSKDKNFELLEFYLKQKTNKEESSDPVFLKNLLDKNTKKHNVRNISKLAEKISDYYITDFSTLDIIKAFNEKENVLIIHFGNLEQTNFLKIHGSFLQFHKAKIFIIGDYLNNFKLNLKKYGFKPLMKNKVGDLIWVKNFQM